MSQTLLITFAYLIGAIPFSILITKLVLGVDVRNAGSGHATTTNTIRQAGWIPGFFVLIFDIAKGYLPVWFALIYGFGIVQVTLVLMASIVGHCWPIFAKFKGGMGLATFGGGLMAIDPMLFVYALGLLISFNLLVKHSAKATILFGFMFPILVWIVFRNNSYLIASIGGGIIISARFTTDWNRKYKELWLDRDKASV
jgi:acyl phosphate:glycerol-3-phosphate acyltransferase